MKVTLREDYLNKTDGKAISPEHLGCHRGKTKETSESLAKLSKTLTGRTKDTHKHLAKLSEKRTGLTKETSETVRRISDTLTGRTAVDFPYLAENGKKAAAKLRGRTKDSHPSIARQAEKIKGREDAARHWEITNLHNEITMVVKNLSKWCKKENLNYSSVKAAAKRGKPHGGYRFVKLTPIDAEDSQQVLG